MVPFHVVSGMNGAIMVLPRDGLKDAANNPVEYDRAYYIGEQDFYVPRDKYGTYKRYNSVAEAMVLLQTLLLPISKPGLSPEVLQLQCCTNFNNQESMLMLIII